MNSELVNLFIKAKAALIVVAREAKIDALASALALQLSLVAQGKNARVCFEGEVENAQKLIGSGQISKKLELGGNTLKVSFPYTDGAIDKVTYNITDDRFNLLIEPRVGQPPLQNKDIEFAYTGAEVDLIITFDAPSLESLGNLYLENPDVFVREKLVNIDRHFNNQEYGLYNLVEKQFSSSCEIIVKLLQALRWDLNPDIATNLYAGLVASTNNFTSFSTNAQSFEMASFLLKAGARKITFAPTQQRPTSFNDFSSAPAVPAVSSAPVDIGSTGAVFQRQPKEEKKVVRPQAEQAKQPPQDWLKPKIFKSSDLI